VHQSITARPDAVFGSGQIGYQVSAAIIGDYFLDVACGQVGRFRDYPDAGLGSFAAGDHAADVVSLDFDWRALLCINARMRCKDVDGDHHEHHAEEIQKSDSSHVISSTGTDYIPGRK